MSPLIAAVLALLPRLFDVVEGVWTVLDGNSQQAQDAAWNAIAQDIPVELRSTFEPYFRALWTNFDDIQEGWAWLEKYLQNGGLPQGANVLPWEGVEALTHNATNAWIERHLAATKVAPLSPPDSGPMFTTDEPATKSEKGGIK